MNKVSQLTNIVSPSTETELVSGSEILIRALLEEELIQSLAPGGL